MFDAYNSALNSAMSFQDALQAQQENILNVYTFGYQENMTELVNTNFGLVMEETGKRTDPALPVFMKGEDMTKMAIDRNSPDAHFLVRDGNKEYLTRLGDFKYTRGQKASHTYIGRPFEERTYLTTKEGYYVMAYPIGRGPAKQDNRYKDPFSDTDHPRLGESPIMTEEKTIGANEPYQYGPMVPMDLTRGSNGLILDKYQKVKMSNNGVVSGLKDGLWVPLYKIAVVSIPNPDGLSTVGNTAYRLETEASGLRQKPSADTKIRPEFIEKSNVNNRLSAYEYKKQRLNLTTALSLQKSNAQLLQQFQQLLQS